MAKLTSSWVKERWSTARKQRDLYNSRFGQNVGVRDFYKNDNPLTRSIQKYNVTIEMKYVGDGYEFFIPQETFNVISFDSPENQRILEENTKQAISQIFRGEAINWVYEHLDVKARGVEKTDISYNEININKLKVGRSYTDDLPQVDVKKKPKNSKGNVNRYKLDLWL
jgi:hypothetical protein